MSWTSWMKILSRESTSRPTEKSDSLMVAESLMSELDFQIHEAQELKFQREQEDRRQKTGVDYSWLVTVPPKTYKMPAGLRLELEQICSRIRPGECGNVLTSFREALLSQPEVSEIPHIMRACIEQALARQPVTATETWSEWVGRRTQSLTNIRLRSSPKVLPVLEEMEMQMKKKCPPSSYSMPDFRSATNQDQTLDV